MAVIFSGWMHGNSSLVLASQSGTGNDTERGDGFTRGWEGKQISQGGTLLVLRAC